MAKSRRDFLTHGSLGLAGMIVGARDEILAPAQGDTQNLLQERPLHLERGRQSVRKCLPPHLRKPRSSCRCS